MHKRREDPPAVPGWGSVARKGAREVKDPMPGSASSAWRDAVTRARGGEEGDARPARRQRWEDVVGERGARAPDARSPAPAPEAASAPRPVPVGRGSRRDDRRRAPAEPGQDASAPKRIRRAAPAGVVGDLTRAVGTRRAGSAEKALMDAARAFERQRYTEAVRLLRRLAEDAPDAAAVRELYGLALYREGRWAAAAKELEAFVQLTASNEQHPVLADCYRALGRHKKVEALWAELAQASPGAELVTEGRIVLAGSLADRGRLDDAVRTLEQRRPAANRPRHHHLRQWYALADLYERAGETVKARELFTRVASHDATFADVAERLASLG